MKISKILAGMSAMAIAGSMMAMVVSADDTEVTTKEPAFKSSVTFSDKNWWTEKEMTLADLIGDVDPSTISEIDFTSDTTFVVAYNTTTADEKKGGWVWHQNEAAVSAVCTDINFGTNDPSDFSLKFALSKGDGVDYTINWSVYTKDADTSSDDVSSSTVSGDSSKAEDSSKPADDSNGDDNSDVVSSVADSSSTTVVDSTNSAATSSKAANNASNTNPSTGAAALAAVGVALAGAAVVATKKRK